MSTEARDILDDLKARLLPLFTRYGLLTGEQCDVPLNILRQIAAKDGDLNVVECRDNIGLFGQTVQMVVRLIVAEERADRAEARAGDAL
ncbi:hypothetical protein F8O06_00690 [Pseudoclavibacter sp. CFCC 14310]|uniref:hypothetical protein n=1 Tax=Pseudoclavibacter sp. CFCC 14310 TaxID=2615180 RepID=UPI00130132B7|nr:hypothetical protein [Pseudoclavibacter sp. CFCC 14310]KAB1647132.1 hypothetical protein F8O06_00690 [Pseudoclavibacter sp. CFCC 14310]